MPINKKSLSVKLRNAIGSSSSQRKLVTSPRLLSDWRAAEPGGDISAFSQCKGKWIITDVWIVQRFLYSAGWSRAGTSDSQDGPGPPLPAHGAGTGSFTRVQLIIQRWAAEFIYLFNWNAFVIW